MSTFYEFRMLNIPARYNLSENGVRMLKAFEDFKNKRLEEEEIGRLIRLSPENRASLIDTLMKCIGVLNNDDQEKKHCTSIMETCTKMIQIAGMVSRYPRIFSFPPPLDFLALKYLRFYVEFLAELHLTLSFSDLIFIQEQ